MISVDYRYLKYQSENGVNTVTMDRPPLNVLTIDMMEELAMALQQADTEAGAVVLLQAAGKAFSAGVDVGDHTPDKVERMIDVFERLLVAMAALNKPLVAAVQGAALGGGLELVLLADMVVASEKARFGQPEVTVGVFPPLACYVLPRLMPWPQAMELLLGGGTVDAARAYALGMVNRVFAPGDFAAGVAEFAARFAQLSPVVLALTKKAARAGLGENFPASLSLIDTIYLNELMTTQDAREGLQAFMEKRHPVWQGR